MPKPQIEIFDGDFTKYDIFVSAFESIIASRLTDEKEKLYHLTQYLKGKPYEIAHSCMRLSNSECYKEAKSQLDERYGDPYKISEAYVKKLLAWTKIKHENVGDLDEFAIMLSSCKNAMTMVPFGNSELSNPRTMRKILEKLPYGIQEGWRRYCGKIMEQENRNVDFDDLVKHVKKEAKILSNPLYGRQMFTNKTKFENIKFVKNEKCNTTKQDQKRKEIRCWYCEKEHFMTECDKILEMKYNDRLKILKDRGLCFSCLKTGHMMNNCTYPRDCQICKKKHLTILHKDEETETKERSQSETEIKALSSLSSKDLEGCNMSIVPVRISCDTGKYVETLAFLDDGSSASFCTEELIKCLGVKEKDIHPTNMSITTMTSSETRNCNLVTGLIISDIEGNHEIMLPPVYSTAVLPVTRQDMVTYSEVKKWKHLSKINLPKYSRGTPTIIIGNNVPAVAEPFEIINAPVEGEPYALKTKIGWVVKGSKSNNRLLRNFNINISNLKLEKMLINMYETEFKDCNEPKKGLSQDDKVFLDIVENGCRKVEGRYELPLPLKPNLPTLPNTKNYALKRLNTLSSKLKREPVYYEHYCTFMEELLFRNYAEPVPQEQLNNENVWYLPHFGVYHPQKPHKIRVVHDCAAEVKGLSLNDILLQGPDLTNNLTQVLLSFRNGSHAFMADIEAMFLQVKVPVKDRDMLRCFWWENGNLDSEPLAYRMTVHLFGAKSSPSCASFALQKTAKDSKGSSEARNSILRNFYVDDCVKAVNGENEMFHLIKELKDVCKEGGFNLTKFTSRSNRLRIEYPEDLSKNLSNVEIGELPEEKVLGIGWNLKNDSLFIELKLNEFIATKRQLLASIACIYDPLGFTAPSLINGRKSLQELCKQKIDWDETIPTQILNEIRNWQTEMNTKQRIDICRDLVIERDDDSKYELHIFSDASEIAYGVVAYLRTIKHDKTECSFVFGKGRIAPIKGVSIPRLELQSATLAVKIYKIIITVLDLKIEEHYFWTDSTTVLRYIRNDTIRFGTFIANRLSLIRDFTLPNQWRYVPTKQNPADDVTRGVQSDRWLKGPKFLYRNKEEWPLEPKELKENSLADLEVKKTVNTINKSDKLPTDKLLEYFSEWNKLVRSVAWIMKFKKILQNRNVTNKSITCIDFKEAESNIVVYLQNQLYREEILALENKLEIKRKSTLKNLDPILYTELRVGGRLKNFEKDLNSRHPIILPNKSHVTELIIKSTHEKIGHMGRSHTLATLREKYWVIKGNSSVRRVLRTCITCKKIQGRPLQQKMAELPNERLTDGCPPFTCVGIDYFGPFYCKKGRSLLKRYGAIFICLTIRAVHLEMAEDMTTSAFINCLRRFIARRGSVKVIQTDRGTNFVGAEKELRLAVNNLNHKMIQQKLLEKEIEWIFNPPYASHFGGSWERQIRNIRKILASMMINQQLTDDSLSTFFCEIEAILNSRPLTQVSMDVKDDFVLTPNHLLTLKTSENCVPIVCAKQYCNNRWKKVQVLADQFWQRWRKEYIAGLQQRQKWHKIETNIKKGDVVLVMDELAQRCHWPLGKIEDVKISKDNLVRSVTVRSRGKLIERPISKIIKLFELDSK